MNPTRSLLAAALVTLAAACTVAPSQVTAASDSSVRPQPEVPLCAHCSASIGAAAEGGTNLEVQIDDMYARAVTTIPVIFHTIDGGSETWTLNRAEVASINDPSMVTVIHFPIDDVVAGEITFGMGRKQVTEPIDIVDDPTW
ncbi:MAG: hypothetical protein ACI8PZ_001348 [Myxococcota bacterium]|jgi:hypothetical protein